VEVPETRHAAPSRRQRPAAQRAAKRVLQHLADLWSYDVVLAEVDADDKVLKGYVINPRIQLVAAWANWSGLSREVRLFPPLNADRCDIFGLQLNSHL